MKKDKGITLIALSITIIVLLIIAGISIQGGSKLIKSSNLENLITNMLLIKTQAKKSVENANFKLGTSFNTITDAGTKNNRLSSAKGELIGTDITDSVDSTYSGKINKKISSGDTNLIFYYKLRSKEDIHEKMNLPDINANDGEYIVEYDIENATVEVYSNTGFTDRDGNTEYSLENLQKMQEDGRAD